MEVDECLQEDRPSDGSLSKRWTCVKYLMERSGPMANPDFEPDPSNLELLRENVKILVVGAGGLGCELLKDLALMGFVDIHVIDMDTIDISNLNRQFLFRPKDVGKPKANVAAEFVNRRVPGCKVTPHYKKIQDYDETFYQQFNIVVCGLDSIVARRWINGMLVSLVGYDEDGNLDPSGIIPLIDGGTEGFKGNARVIIPGMSACIECNLDLFPPQVTFPMCTIATIPRLPAHCIEYVRVLQWPQDKPFGVAKGKEIQVEILTQNVQLLYQGAYSNMLTDLHLSFENWDMISKQTLPQEEDVGIDGDDPEHIQWIYNKALERAANFGIQGLSYRLTQGVIKHIIPAVASTNAVIAAICANEVFKLATRNGIEGVEKWEAFSEFLPPVNPHTHCYPIMNNYMVFNDTEGIYTYTFEAERRDDCPACSKKPLDISLPAQAKLQDLIEELKENPRTQMKSPGLTTIVGGKNKTLYMPNIPAIETRTRPNLEKLLKDLGIEDKQEIHVSDVTSPKMAICRVHLNEGK